MSYGVSGGVEVIFFWADKPLGNLAVSNAFLTDTGVNLVVVFGTSYHSA